MRPISAFFFAGLGFFFALGVNGLGGVFRSRSITSSSLESLGALDMGNRLFPIHRRFPEELGIVARILLDYGELEIGLMHCVQMARGGDLNGVLKAMFRARGEKQRIDIADGLGRVPYHGLGMGTDFEMAIGAMHHCRKIRNQYAHAYWHDDLTGRLCFVGLEDLAREKAAVNDLLGLTFFYLDVPLLEEQARFVGHTESFITYVNYQGRVLAGILASQPFPKPTAQTRPALHCP